MTTELAGRIRTMCNLSENIKKLGVEEGVKKERLNAIKRMMDAGLTKDQVILCGYTKDELEEAKNVLYANA